MRGQNPENEALTPLDPRVLTLELESSNLPKRSWIKISQIRTLSAERIGDVIATLPPETLSRLVDGLNEIIG